MTKKNRTIIFLVCSFLFILIAPSAVLYSQGYRVDFESKKITQTGGLFLKILPRQAEVFIDEKINKKTDFFFGSVLIENLLPKRYKVEIKKEGYHSWQKTLEIKEKEVSEAKNIILFPENPNFNVLSGDIEQFWFSPDKKKIILKERGEFGWALKLYDLDKNIKSHLIDKEDISPTEVQLQKLDFSDDSKKVYLELGLREQIKYFTLEFDKATPILIANEAPLPAIKNAIAYRKLMNNDIYYLDSAGHLFKNGERMTTTPFPIKQETAYALEVFPNFIFLREDNNLYKFDADLKTFEIFFEGVNSLKISPDNKKLVYSSEHEIWILFLSSKNDQPQKKAGERLFLIRLSEKINDVSWIDSNHLIFSAGGKVKISEIDERDRVNVIDIALFENPQIFWNESRNKLYVLSEDNLYQSEKLIK